MLAKGKVFVSMEKLAEILSLPKGVEIIAVKPKGNAEEGFEFLVMSAEETLCTKKNVGMNLLRRVGVETLERYKSEGVVASGDLVLETIPFPEVTIGEGKSEVIFTVKQAQFHSVKETEKEKTVKDSFEDVLKVAQRKGKF